MAKNGYKIFDSDMHVGPFMDVLDKYLADTQRKKLAMAWEIKEERRRKLMWDNACKLYARADLQ
jgi:phage gp16-like protein